MFFIFPWICFFQLQDSRTRPSVRKSRTQFLIKNILRVQLATGILGHSLRRNQFWKPSNVYTFALSNNSRPSTLGPYNGHHLWSALTAFSPGFLQALPDPGPSPSGGQSLLHTASALKTTPTHAPGASSPLCPHVPSSGEPVLPTTPDGASGLLHPPLLIEELRDSPQLRPWLPATP